MLDVGLTDDYRHVRRDNRAGIHLRTAAPRQVRVENLQLESAAATDRSSPHYCQCPWPESLLHELCDGFASAAPDVHNTIARTRLKQLIRTLSPGNGLRDTLDVLQVLDKALGVARTVNATELRVEAAV